MQKKWFIIILIVLAVVVAGALIYTNRRIIFPTSGKKATCEDIYRLSFAAADGGLAKFKTGISESEAKDYMQGLGLEIRATKQTNAHVFVTVVNNGKSDWLCAAKAEPRIESIGPAYWTPQVNQAPGGMDQ